MEGLVCSRRTEEKNQFCKVALRAQNTVRCISEQLAYFRKHVARIQFPYVNTLLTC